MFCLEMGYVALYLTPILFPEHIWAYSFQCLETSKYFLSKYTWEIFPIQIHRHSALTLISVFPVGKHNKLYMSETFQKTFLKLKYPIQTAYSTQTRYYVRYYVLIANATRMMFRTVLSVHVYWCHQIFLLQISIKYQRG